MVTQPTKTAVIIGAGPAGLTAALEFVRRSEIHPIVLEASQEIGGISRTIRYNGNRMDIGGPSFLLEVGSGDGLVDCADAHLRRQKTGRENMPFAIKIRSALSRRRRSILTW